MYKELNTTETTQSNVVAYRNGRSQTPPQPNLEAKQLFSLLSREDGQIFEIRGVNSMLKTDKKPYDKPRIISGYFDDADTLATAITAFDDSSEGVYITINPCKEGTFSRAANRLNGEKGLSTTADAEIEKRQILFLDCDPEREGGIRKIPTNNSEHQAALDFIEHLTTQLDLLGWPQPIEIDSGNGGYLIYAIDLPADDDGLIQRVLAGLDKQFSTETVHIDLTAFNQARIMRVPGTWNCKADSTKKRPHRQANIISMPETLEVVSREQLEAVAAPAEPEPEKVTQAIAPSDNGYQKASNRLASSEDFLNDFLRRNNINTRRETGSGYTRYVLIDGCVFNETHRGKDAAVIIHPNQTLGYKCFHNSCAGKSWEDFAKHVEPGYMTSKEKNAAYEAAQAAKKAQLKLVKPAQALDIKAVDAAIVAKNVDNLVEAVKVFAQLPRASWIPYKPRIKKAFGEDVSLNDLEVVIKEAREEAKAADNQEANDADDPLNDMDTVANLFYERYGDTWAYDIIGQCWRNYTGTHWREQEKHAGTYEVDTLLLPIIHERGHEIKSNTLLSCAHRLIEGKCRRVFVAPHNLINFKNGTLVIPSLKMRKHRREDGLLYCLDYEYKPNMPHPRIDKYMQTTWLKRKAESEYETDHHMIQALETHIGLGLMGDVSMHQFIAQLGAKRAGKSMTMRLANAACGVVNEYETEPIGRYGNFAGNDLFDNELEGKRVRFQRRNQRIVCCDELSPDVFITGEELIKDMTAHSGVPMRGMQKDDLANNTWRAKVLISTNNLPRFVDYSGAVKERAVCIEAPITIPKEQRNLNLLSELLEELPGFVHTCIQLAIKSLQRGYYPQSGYMKARAMSLATGSNLLKRFIHECCVLEPGKTVPSNLIYSKLCDFRDTNGHKGQFTLQTMTHEILNMHIGVHNNEDKVSRKYDGTPKRLLFNIRLRDEYEEIPEYTTKDDELLNPEISNGVTVFVTGCNEDVTEARYKWHTPLDGSTSQSTETTNQCCNDVTDFSENSSNRTPTLPPDTDTQVSSIQNKECENPVTSLQSLVDEPVEPPVDVTDPSYTTVTSPLQIHLSTLHRGLWVNTPAGVGQITSINSMSVDVDCMGSRKHYTGLQIMQITAR